MRRRGAVLRSGDRQRRSFKVHLRPLQVTQLGRSQAMPEGDQDHGLIPLRPAIAAAAGDQPLDLAFAEVFAGSDIGVLGPARLDFPYYSGWGDDFQGWFWHVNPLSRLRDFLQDSCFTASYKVPFSFFFRSGNWRAGLPPPPAQFELTWSGWRTARCCEHSVAAITPVLSSAEGLPIRGSRSSVEKSKRQSERGAAFAKAGPA